MRTYHRKIKGELQRLLLQTIIAFDGDPCTGCGTHQRQRVISNSKTLELKVHSAHRSTKRMLTICYEKHKAVSLCRLGRGQRRTPNGVGQGTHAGNGVGRLVVCHRLKDKLARQRREAIIQTLENLLTV